MSTDCAHETFIVIENDDLNEWFCLQCDERGLGID
jgi:hypothetical protein